MKLLLKIRGLFLKSFLPAASVSVSDAMRFSVGTEFYVRTNVLFTEKGSSVLFIDGSAVVETAKTDEFPLKIRRAEIFFETAREVCADADIKRLNSDFFPKKYFLLETRKSPLGV